MKKDFRTIKNLILLMASALTLVAVTFAWYSLSKKTGDFVINSNVSGSTIAVQYFESKDGTSYTKLDGALNMSNMYEGETAHYRMDVKTFSDNLVRLIMGFEGLSNTNAAAKYVYFDYKLVCPETGDELASGEKLRMSDYTSANVFAQDVSLYQKNGKCDFSIYYDVYVITNGESVPSDTTSLGEVKLIGQQVS